MKNIFFLVVVILAAGCGSAPKSADQVTVPVAPMKYSAE